VSVEWYAVAVALVGICLWLWGSVLDSVIAMMFFTLFGGGAAFIVGHATIQPGAFAMTFVLAHLLLSMFTGSGHARLGLRVNNYLALFSLYGAVTAFILPRIFTHALWVSPLTGFGTTLYMTGPVHPSIQNITTALYLLATFITSIAASAASADPKARRKIIIWAVVIAWTHVFFGLVGAVLTDYGGGDIIKIFRNATYAELTQDEAGLTRLAGVFPEPSAYAGYAFGWFVFMNELWLRDVATRWTFPTAIALLLVLIGCTSTTGYASIALYALLMLIRFVIAPRSLRASKVIPVLMGGLAMTCVVILACAFLPHLASTVGRVLHQLTVSKGDSASAHQRMFWVSNGLKAFKATWGLGIGAGSFRSSSLLVAVLGGMGFLGVLFLGAHVMKILKPLRRDTYDLPGNPGAAVGVAAAWAACAGLIPALLSAPSPDPSFVFAIMGGLALGWRDQPRLAAAPAAARRSPSGPPAGVPEVA
jgi:hypothetical protein